MKNEVMTSNLLAGIEAIQKFNKNSKVDFKKLFVAEASIAIEDNKLLMNSITWEGKHQLSVKMQIENTDNISTGIENIATLTKALKKFNNYTGLEIKNNNIVFTDGKKNMALKTLEKQDLTEHDFKEANVNTINGVEFKNAYDKVKKTIAKDDTRPILTGIHFNKDFIETVDGFRVSRIKLSETNFNNMVIPNTYIDIILAVAKKNKSDIVLCNTDKTYSIKTSFSGMEICLVGNLMEREFFDTEKIFRTENEIEISFSDKKELMEEVSFISDIIGTLDPKKNPIIFDIAKNKIEISAKLEDTITSTNIDINKDINSSLKIAFNNVYLLDAIKNIDGEFSLNFLSPLTPLIVENEIEKYLILPIRLVA